MVAGAQSVKIRRAYVPVRVSVEMLHGLCAHADAEEITAWLRHFKRPPRSTFITHGEGEASDALRRRVTEELGWPCIVPEFQDQVLLYE
jgi:metallo-beta-lactamase family protein